MYSDEEDRGRYGRTGGRQGGNISRGRRGYSRSVIFTELIN